MIENTYLPIEVKITEIKQLSPYIKTLRIKKNKGRFPKNKQGLAFIPGQFVVLGVWGYGEAPFEPASSPFENRFMDIVVGKVGVVTSAIHHLKENDVLTLRGPYGNGYPLNFFKSKDLLLIAGGYAFPAICSLAEYLVKCRKNFGRLYLLYGASSPENILLKEKLSQWKKHIKILLTVDKPSAGWKGHKGLVSELVDDIAINPANAAAIMAGAEPMMEALEKIIRPLGISDRRIFVSLTRKMQCSAGKCQHCVCGDKYVCQDGPIFNFDEIDKAHD